MASVLELLVHEWLQEILWVKFFVNCRDRRNFEGLLYLYISQPQKITGLSEFLIEVGNI